LRHILAHTKADHFKRGSSRQSRTMSLLKVNFVMTIKLWKETTGDKIRALSFI